MIIHPLPEVDFVFSGNCLENPTLFSDNSVITFDSLTSFIWYFGDGESSIEENPSHTYIIEDDHIYNIILQVGIVIFALFRM